MSKAQSLAGIDPAHAFDTVALQSYLTESIEGFSGDLTIRQFTAGQSNPTFQLTAGGKKYVLRKNLPAICCPPPMRWTGNSA